jgi:predicted NBD/HSP70 family sugar kinase
MRRIVDALENALDDIVAFLPKLLAFLLILIIGYIIAKAIEKILDKVLQRVGFDRLVERGGVKRVLARSEFDASSILGRIVFYAIMLFVLSTAFGVFGENPISDYLSAIIAYLPKLFVAILIVVVAAAIAAGVKGLVETALGGVSYGRVVANAASVLILALGVIAALNQLEIARTVVNAVLYAFLAILVGVTIVAVGGGGIAPMRQRWEQALAKMEAKGPQLRQSLREGRERVASQGMTAAVPEQFRDQQAPQGQGSSGATQHQPQQQYGQQYGQQQYDPQQYPPPPPGQGYGQQQPYPQQPPYDPGR